MEEHKCTGNCKDCSCDKKQDAKKESDILQKRVEIDLIK